MNVNHQAVLTGIVEKLMRLLPSPVAPVRPLDAVTASCQKYTATLRHSSN